MKKVFKVLVGIFIVLFALLYISGNSYVIPGLIKIYGTGHTTAFLHDYNVFDNYDTFRALDRGTSTQSLVESQRILYS